MILAEDSFYDRFGGIARLLGLDALSRLQRSHVCVIGIGGVGSWTVEALARSGIGALTLIDPDVVCQTNINRQLPALNSTVGKSKAEVLAERIQDFSPDCQVHPILEFFLPSNAERLLNAPFDFVVDAVDRMSIKALILHQCRLQKHPVLTVGGAGGRSDPTQIRIRDFGEVGGDELLRLVRRKLRRDFDWEGGNGHIYKIPAVYSAEPMRYPTNDGQICASPIPNTPVRMDCAAGLGAATFVTGTFGFVAASEVIRQLILSSE